MNANAATVLAFIARVRRRQTVLSILQHAAFGLGVAVIASALMLAVTDVRGTQLVVIGLGIGGLLAGAFDGILVSRRRHTGLEIERRAPQCQNVVVTASELLAHCHPEAVRRGVNPERSRSAPQDRPHGGPASDYVLNLVTQHAAEAVKPLAPSTLFPSRNALTAIGSALLLWIGTIGLAATRDPVAPVTFGAAPRPDEVGAIEVTVTPPSYARRSAQRLTNPTRIDALAGSRISLTVRGTDVRVETLEGELRPTANLFTLSAVSDGFIAIRAGASARRLIGLTVTPDQNPRVRITAPGKDMFLADSIRRIPVEIDARDDLGLTTLKLRYTKVSGSGERFTFVEGEVPITTERTNDRDWRARGTLDLGALKLQQGDMVVYRGAAADGRPGVPLTESDAFIVEITSPLSIAAEGFSLDDQQDKYALSQQMVILKTERLLARAAALPAESLTYYSQSIAAEQRSVRAEFVFMMGGEVAEEVIAAAGMDIDETHEAENEDELLAGRMVNRGRVALVEAIRLMSRASTRLNEGNPQAALPVERQALVALQAAFSRTRYLLRALTLRERLDLSRRLTGVLTLAARDARSAESADPDAAVVSLRSSLAAIATLAASDSTAKAAASAIAQRVLAVDPSDSTLQRVAARLDDGSRQALDDAATLLTAALRSRVPRDEPVTESPELRRLRGSLSDALRGRGGR